MKVTAEGKASMAGNVDRDREDEFNGYSIKEACIVQEFTKS